MKVLKILKRNKSVVSLFVTVVIAFSMIGMGIPGGVSKVNAKPFPKETNDPQLILQAYVRDKGWLEETRSIAGTTGKGLGLEALRARINNSRVRGGILINANSKTNAFYQSANCGSTTGICGTVGQAQPIYSLSFALTGDIAGVYTIQYRVYVTNEGWTDWFKNGQLARGKSDQQIEAVEAQIIKDGRF